MMFLLWLLQMWEIVIDEKVPLHVTKAPYEESQKEQIFTSRSTIRGKVCGLII